MVILMSPTDQTNLWNAEFKINVEGNFKCCCLIKRAPWPSCDILWRPRPEASLSVKLPGNQSRKILARSSWIRTHTRLSPAHILRSSMAEMPSILQLRSDRPREDNSVFIDTISPIRNSSHSSGTFQSNHPIEEPWLLQSSVSSDDSHGLTVEDKIVSLLNSDFLESKSINQSNFEDVPYSEDTVSAVDKSSDRHRISFESYQPVEEPWLFESSPFFPSSEESVKDEATDTKFYDQHQEVPDKFFSDEECTIIEAFSASLDPTARSKAHLEGSSNYTSTSQTDEEVSVDMQKDSASTIILINSSLCTMQRIAILEDGKLVELLLEPVKNDVQCDSVYLGTVTKLVPNMSGALVNIGSARASLMGIKPYKKPFIFPPFRSRKEKGELKGSVVGELREHPGANEDVQNSDDVEVIDDIKEHKIEDASIQYLHDDFGEHEIEDDFDVMEDLKENVNGNVVSYEAGVNSEKHLNKLDVNGHHIDGQIFSKLLPIDLGSCHSSQPSILEVVKDCKETWAQVQKGTKVIVQVAKEGLGTKGPMLTAYPKLRSRFWILSTRSNNIGISKKISGFERTRLKVVAKTLRPPGYGLILRTVAAGHSLEELQKDLDGLLSTWKAILENAKSAALAADEGVEGAVPVLLHRAMGQTLSVAQDYFNEKVKSMVVDSPRTYHEVTHYLQEIAPNLCDRVELYNKRTPLFDEYNIEEEFNNILSKRVSLSNGGYLVIEQTEALVSIDVNGGHRMISQVNSSIEKKLNVNLYYVKWIRINPPGKKGEAHYKIARELRLRDIGGIIVVDFIDMLDDTNKRLVYEEVKKAVERDRSVVKVSELSRHGLMEITRKRVRPSVTFMVTEPCTCCHATGRVEALETSFSKIEQEICRLLATMDQKEDPGSPKSWPRFILKIDQHMSNYLTSGRRTRLALLSSSLKVWILLKVARNFTKGGFELKPLAGEKEHKKNQAAISSIRPSEGGTYIKTPKGKFSIFPRKKWNTSGSK
ncbi:hypothetical protein LguiB_018985 [Lonicera macranthoides]